MDESTNLFKTTVETMKQVESVSSGDDGISKKQMVLSIIEKQVKNEYSNPDVVSAIMSTVSFMIDGVVDIAKKNIDVKVLKKKMKSCFALI